MRSGNPSHLFNNGGSHSYQHFNHQRHLLTTTQNKNCANISFFEFKYIFLILLKPKFIKRLKYDTFKSFIRLSNNFLHSIIDKHIWNILTKINFIVFCKSLIFCQL